VREAVIPANIFILRYKPYRCDYMKLKFLFVIALFVSCLTDSAGQDLAAILSSSKTAAEKAELITIQARRFFKR